MQKRTKVISSVAFLFICIVVFLSIKKSDDGSNGDTGEPVSGKMVGDTAVQDEDTQIDLVSEEVAATTAAIQRAERYKALRAAENVEISFFGSVIDQDDVGIEGCNITFQFSGYEEATNTGDSGTFELIGTATTDVDGGFIISGIKGRSLRILDIKKNSYVSEQGGASSFTYGTRFGGRHTPKASDPVVFRMHKAKEGFELLPINERLDIRANSNQQEVTMPLRFGPSHQPLTLKFSFDRTTQTSSNTYDWSYTVRLVDGSIRESDNDALLLAPDDGYNERIEQSYSAGSSDWNMHSQKLLYLRHEDGLSYAGIELSVFSYKDGRSRIIVKGNLNPTGRLVVNAH